jgi:hypothetical protein
VARLPDRFRDAVAVPGTLARGVALILAAATLVVSTKVVLGPFFDDLTKAGFHDWDSAAAYRYITVVALKKYHELPWYNPFLCGGFPAWAYGEGAPNLVSIYLPFYIALPILTALRVEILGSAVISLLGAYALAARYTKSVALRTLTAAVYTLNGRWALQTAAGHSWHLQYAWTPLALLFFDMACERGRSKWALAAGAALAAMLYQGGIYPVPQTALVLLCFALSRAIFDRTPRPIGAFAIAGLSSIGFSAPKLLPIVDLMRRYERKIDSTETIGLNELGAMLTSHDQNFNGGAAFPHAYGWHEWGMYLGWPMVYAMWLALIFAQGARQMPAKLSGLLFLVLSLGAFADYAPWTLLHKLPAFASQHVPSRFLYIACLCLMLVLVGWTERWLGALIGRAPWIDVLLVIPVWFCVMDIAEVSRVTTEAPFSLRMPAITWHKDFKHIVWPAYNYEPPGAWAGPSLPAMMANEGFLGCYSVPDRAEPHGAVAERDPTYRGEAHVEEGSGYAAVTHWSPNGVEVAYSGATPGAVLVYNMNYDTSWRADGHPALEYQHAVATRLDAAEGTVRFRYFPRMLPWGLLLFAATSALAVWGYRPRRVGAKSRRRALRALGG